MKKTVENINKKEIVWDLSYNNPLVKNFRKYLKLNLDANWKTSKDYQKVLNVVLGKLGYIPISVDGKPGGQTLKATYIYLKDYLKYPIKSEKELNVKTPNWLKLFNEAVSRVFLDAEKIKNEKTTKQLEQAKKLVPKSEVKKLHEEEKNLDTQKEQEKQQVIQQTKKDLDNYKKAVYTVIHDKNIKTELKNEKRTPDNLDIVHFREFIERLGEELKKGSIVLSEKRVFHDERIYEAVTGEKRKSDNIIDNPEITLNVSLKLNTFKDLYLFNSWTTILDHLKITYKWEDVTQKVIKALHTYNEDYQTSVINNLQRELFNALLKKFGYEDDRGFFHKLFTLSFGEKWEKESLLARLDNFEKIQKLAGKEKLTSKELNLLKGYLFDRNFDAVIQTAPNGVQSELREFIDTASEKQLKTLMKNIGLDYNDIFKDIGFRERFNDRLSTFLAIYPLKILLMENGPKKYMELVSKFKKEAIKKIEEQSKTEQFKQEVILPYLRTHKIPGTSQAIEKARQEVVNRMITKLESEPANILVKKYGWIGYNAKDHKAWIGVNLFKEGDISTNLNLVDLAKGSNTASLGVDYSKKLNNNLSASIWAGAGINWLFGTIGAKYYTWNWLSKERWGVGVNFITGPAWFINLFTKNTDTVEFFNNFMYVTGKTFDYFLAHMKDWKDVTKADAKDFFGDITDEQFNQLKSDFKKFKQMYETLHEQGVPDNVIKKAYLETIANQIYGQVEWLRANGLGILIIPWLLATLAPMVEYNWRNYKAESRNIFEQKAEETLTQTTPKQMVENDINLKEKINIQKDKIVFDYPFFVKYVSSNIDGKVAILHDRKTNKVIVTPQEGYVLVPEIVKKETYEKVDGKLTTVDKYEISLTTIKSEGGEKIYKNNELIQQANLLSKNFNYHSRYLPGAKDLINTKNDFATRWKALDKLTKYVPWLKEVVQQAKTYQDKEYLISKVATLLKTSKEANITTRTIEEIVKRDSAEVQNVFNNIERKALGFDFSKYRQEFFNQLKWKEQQYFKAYSVDNVIGLDVVSSVFWINWKKKALKGLDEIKYETNILWIESWPIKIPLSDADKQKVIEKLKLSWQKNKISNIYFAKSANGFDDVVLVEFKEKGDLLVAGNAVKQSDVVKANYGSWGATIINLGGPFTKDLKKENNEIWWSKTKPRDRELDNSPSNTQIIEQKTMQNVSGWVSTEDNPLWL